MHFVLPLGVAGLVAADFGFRLYRGTTAVAVSPVVTETADHDYKVDNLPEGTKFTHYTLTWEYPAGAGSSFVWGGSGSPSAVVIPVREAGLAATDLSLAAYKNGVPAGVTLVSSELGSPGDYSVSGWPVDSTGATWVLVWRRGDLSFNYSWTEARGALTGRTLLATLELTKRATFTGLSQAATMPASYLKHPQPRRRWRATSLSQIEVKVDLTAALAAVQDTGIDSYRWVLPLYASATRNATHEIWLGPTSASVDATGTAALHIGPVAFWRSLDNDRGRFPRRHSWIDLGSQRTDLWARYKITDAGNPDGFHDLGLLIFHPGYLPAHPIAEKPVAGVYEDLREFVGVSGSRRREKRPRERLRTLVLQATGPNCRDEVEAEWLALEEIIGVSEPLVVIEDVAATSKTMNKVCYGVLEGEPEKIALPNPYNKAELSLSVREML